MRPAVPVEMARFGADIVRQCAEIAGDGMLYTSSGKQRILRKFGME